MPADTGRHVGVPPFTAALRVLHVLGPGGLGSDAAEHQRAGGWEVTTVSDGYDGWRHALSPSPPGAVVLHGPAAGAVAALRAVAPTVLVPHGARPGRAERRAARWTSAVALADPAEVPTWLRARVWAPLFVVGDDLDVLAAVTVRARAFGPDLRRVP